jgi:hypothetical protein
MYHTILVARGACYLLLSIQHTTSPPPNALTFANLPKYARSGPLTVFIARRTAQIIGDDIIYRSDLNLTTGAQELTGILGFGSTETAIGSPFVRGEH